MGVAWVLSTSETLRSIEVSLERAGAVKTGPFKVDCQQYRPTQVVADQIPNFFVLHHSNFPDSSVTFGDFKLIKDAKKEKDVEIVSSCSVSDLGFDLILQKFSGGLVNDSLQSFDVSGNEYALKDFRIRCGTVQMGKTSNKGVIVEFEFAPCQLASHCYKMLGELVHTFFPEGTHPVPIPLNRHERAPPEIYCTSDTMEQYLRIFRELKKPSGA